MGDPLVNIHGTVMILAWMGFGCPGILFAHYGRVLRFGNKRQLLGKSIWFQIHRFYLTVSSVFILMGFFFISVNGYGQWMTSNDVVSKHIVAHSIIGTIVVCCVFLQILLALYRCHPNSHFRFLFNWSHRIVGGFAFFLALTNIFIMTFVLSTYQIILITTISVWTIFNVITVICFEIIQYHYRKAARLIAMNNRVSSINQENVRRNSSHDVETINHPAVENRRLNTIRLILFLINYLISLALCIPLIVLIWLQN